jgi:hypothetical protein
VQSKNFHVEAKPMLRDEKILLYTENDGRTATKHNQTTAQADQTAI